MKFYQFSILLLISIIFQSCAKDNANRAGIDPAAQKLAARNIELSFNVKKTEASADRSTPTSSGSAAQEIKSAKIPSKSLSVDNAHVVIQKSALGKEFLLSVNLLSQTPTPMFSSLQSRVVSFILRDQKVYLLDVTKNDVVAPATNIPQTLLIAEYPILNETKTSLEIDFNSGMKQIFESGDMNGENPDLSSAEYSLTASQVRLSYLDEVTLQNSTSLFIRQIAQLEAADNMVRAVEVRYQIKPYLPDAEFVPMKALNFDKVGYFEANPLLLADGSTRVYAMKWNEKKTIRFAISANTPAKYRELVKSALLYWNKILGDKAIEVVQLEDKNLTAPRFDMNIIQWADWDGAGFAFADAHIDPRSGEVTSAQIFFPSAFIQAAVASRIRVTEATRPVIGLKGFKSARLCSRNLMNDLAGREMSEAVTPKAMDKAVKDYVYEVIAHELGHVMGLRHNFAGSLAANYDYKDRKELILSYYKNLKAPPGVVTSNSVMEYSRFEESAFNGDQFRNGGKALAYDEMAIKYLYFKTPLPAQNRPLFCTDSDKKLYADCNTSDAGRSVVSAAVGAYQANLKAIAARLINMYIASSKEAYDLATDLVPVSEVNLNAGSMAKSTSSELAKFVSLMKEGTRFVAVRSPYKPILSTMTPEIEKLEKEYLQTEVTRLGGLESLTKEISADFSSDLVSKFSELLDDPMYNSGVSKDGSQYAFTSDEKYIMKQQVALFAVQMKEWLILNEISILSGDNFPFAQYGQRPSETKVAWMDTDLTFDFSHILIKRFAHYALAKTTDKLISEITLKDGTKKKIELPVYQNAQNIRITAAKLLSNDHKAVDWGFQEKQAAVKLITEELSLLGETDKIDMSSLDRNTVQWILNNKKLLAALAE